MLLNNKAGAIQATSAILVVLLLAALVAVGRYVRLTKRIADLASADYPLPKKNCPMGTRTAGTPYRVRLGRAVGVLDAEFLFHGGKPLGEFLYVAFLRKRGHVKLTAEGFGEFGF